MKVVWNKLILYDMMTWNLLDIYTCPLQGIWQCTVVQKCIFLFKNSKDQFLFTDVIGKEFIIAWYDDLEYSRCFEVHAQWEKSVNFVQKLKKS